MRYLQRTFIILSACGLTSILLTLANPDDSNAFEKGSLIDLVNNSSSCLLNSRSPKSTRTSNVSGLLPSILVDDMNQTGTGSFYIDMTAKSDELKQQPQLNRLAHKSTKRTQHYKVSKLKSTSAEINVNGFVAHTKITQVFSNNSDAVGSGMYIFPLPCSATVYYLRMQVGEQITEKIISHEHLPNRVLEQNQHLALKASLLPQLPPNVFTSHLANIAPYSEVTVTIFYRQLIEQNNHKFQFRLPLISKQAYSPLVNSPDKSIEFDDNKDIKTAGAEDLDTTNLAILPAKTSIKVRLNAGLPLNQIKSKHHPIKMTKLFETQYDIELDTLQPANKDFILLWQWRLGDHIQASHFKAKTKIDVLINNKYINKNSTLDLIT